jgi:hypothetical protein
MRDCAPHTGFAVTKSATATKSPTHEDTNHRAIGSLCGAAHTATGGLGLRPLIYLCGEGLVRDDQVPDIGDAVEPPDLDSNLLVRWFTMSTGILKPAVGNMRWRLGRAPYRRCEWAADGVENQLDWLCLAERLLRAVPLTPKSQGECRAHGWVGAVEEPS